MVTMAVVGATGLAGRHVCRWAESAGHRVVPLSRSVGVDVLTGQSLPVALDRVDVVVDASNVRAPGREPSEVLMAAMEHLAAACITTGVRRLVLLSINGIDDPGFDDFPYYVAKRAQEAVLRQSGMAFTILRSAQWFEFSLNPAAVTASADQVTVEDWLIQPVAVDAVAAELVAAGASERETVTVAGPDVLRLPELTARYLRARGDHRPVQSTPPGLAAFGSGALLASPGARIVGPSIDTWLTRAGELRD